MKEAMGKVSPLIFREYDIRGIAGRDLTGEIARLVGRAFGTLVKAIHRDEDLRVSVGRDARLSSDELTEALIEGIVATGVGVYDLGICPTPLQYFSLHRLGLSGGVMVTGSHNPPEYNGFKLSIGRETIHGAAIQQLRHIIERGDYHLSPRQGDVVAYDIINAYRQYMQEHFSSLRDSNYRVFRVVVDAGNGTGGLVAPELLRHLGCEVVELYCEPDGRFPNHHPDPTVIENMQDLIETTVRTGADLGVGYDGDVDRIGVVDPRGRIIWGDQILVILARDILKSHPGAKVIGDVKCSDFMFKEVKKAGGVPIMWKTGHSLVKEKMKQEGAILAGELSGHIFIADRYFGYDDAIYTTLRLIEVMKKEGKGIEELLADVPTRYNTPEIRIECPEEKKRAVVQRVVERFRGYMRNGGCPYELKEIYDIDGVRAVFERGWVLLRSSNTQPVVVMRAEADDEETLEKLKVYMMKEFEIAMEEI